MHETRELKLLFATRYTDPCFQAIRAVAQMAEAFRLSVTIAYVGSEDAAPNRELQSFFAEADHYESCRRVYLHGSPMSALAEFARKGEYDLILAPRSDRVGVPRPFHRSLRAQLLRHAGTPVWTGSRAFDASDFLRPYRTIAVGFDNQDEDLTHLHLAAAFAASVGAELKLLTVVPTVDEGTLVKTAFAPEPLCEEAALERIRKLLSHWSRVPAVEVAIGAPARELPRLAAKCQADLLFLSQAQSCSGLFWPQMSRAVDQAPCGVISIPAALRAEFKWSFLTHASSARQRLQELVDGHAGRTPSRLLTPRQA